MAYDNLRVFDILLLEILIAFLARPNPRVTISPMTAEQPSSRWRNQARQISPSTRGELSSYHRPNSKNASAMMYSVVQYYTAHYSRDEIRSMATAKPKAQIFGVPRDASAMPRKRNTQGLDLRPTTTTRQTCQR